MLPQKASLGEMLTAGMDVGHLIGIQHREIPTASYTFAKGERVRALHMYTYPNLHVYVYV